MKWTKLTKEEANGVITNYTICYKLTNSSDGICDTSEVAGEDKDTHTLTGLNEATSYDVAMKAATSVGFSGTGNSKTASTMEDSELFLYLV